MKNSFKFAAILLALTLTAVTGCKDDPVPTPDPDPTDCIVFENSTVEISGEAGTYTVAFTRNAEEDITYELSDETWISNVVIGNNNLLSFDATLNEPGNDARSATFTFSAEGSLDVTLTVTQGTTTNYNFEYTKTVTGYDFVITPRDTETGYFYYPYEESELTDYEGDTIGDKIAYGLQNIVDLYVAIYGIFGYSVDQVLEILFVPGVAEDSYSIYTTDLNQYVGVCQADETGVLTLVEYGTYVREAVGESGLTVDMAISDLTSMTAVCTFTPSDSSIPYHYNAFAASYIEGMSDDEIETFLRENFGYNIVSYVATGEFTANASGLSPNTDYVSIAVGFEAGFFTTEIFKETFTTPAATDPEECTFEFSSSKVDAYTYYVDVVPSHSDVYYFLDWVAADEGTTLDDIKADYEYYFDLYLSYGYTMTEILNNFAYMGEASGNVSLTPATEYTFYITRWNLNDNDFGSSDTHTVVTDEAVEGKATVDIQVPYYWDLADLYEYYPEDEDFEYYYNTYIASGSYDFIYWAPTTVVVTGDYSEVYYGAYTYEEDIDDQTYINALINRGARTSLTTTYLLTSEKITWVGFAIDTDGNYGPLFREVAEYSADGASDPADYPYESSSFVGKKGVSELGTIEKLDKKANLSSKVAPSSVKAEAPKEFKSALFGEIEKSPVKFKLEDRK